VQRARWGVIADAQVCGGRVAKCTVEAVTFSINLGNEEMTAGRRSGWVRCAPSYYCGATTKENKGHDCRRRLEQNGVGDATRAKVRARHLSPCGRGDMGAGVGMANSTTHSHRLTLSCTLSTTKTSRHAWCTKSQPRCTRSCPTGPLGGGNQCF
jgi:hypothetical protein